MIAGGFSGVAYFSMFYPLMFARVRLAADCSSERSIHLNYLVLKNDRELKGLINCLSSVR
jgi:hypothetical protein